MFIYTADYREYPRDYVNSGSTFVQLCSGITLNHFSSNTFIVFIKSFNTQTVFLSKDKTQVSDHLPIQLRHCELFWWWLHCATLDIEREDEFIDFCKII